MAMKLIAGLDIGNGYVKGSVAGQELSHIDVPSCIVHGFDTHDIKKITDIEIADTIADIYNSMDVHYETPLVTDKRRCLLGTRAVLSGRTPEEFDVHAARRKATQPLTAMLSLSCIAGKALQEAYKREGRLPQAPIDVSVVAAFALPISEYKDMYREYAAGYMASQHAVVFHNFQNEIRVNIMFEHVQVTAEGASAQFGIASKGIDLVTMMLQDIRNMGEPLEGVAPEHIFAATSILGVDIGEGTVNFPVFQNNKLNTDVSMTLDKGYGEVMERSMEQLAKKNIGFVSRKSLTEFLNNPMVNTASPIYQRKYKMVADIVDAEIMAFADEVATQFGKIMNRVSMEMEVIYVYGGGATPVKRELYPMLIRKAKECGGGQVLSPILYLDSRYSRYLNREGLFAMAEKVARSRK